MENNYFFTNKLGEFKLQNPRNYHYLYFPLVGSTGMKSSITPFLQGDAKLDQNSFALLPVSQEDLHSSLLSRNIWLNIDGSFTSLQDIGNATKDYANTVVEGGLLYHTLTHTNRTFETILTSFVPFEKDHVEVHKLTYRNLTEEVQDVQITLAIPIYGRSAESIRDHRHVTALLNRAYVVKNGIINYPTMTFDERGHSKNKRCYGVFAASNDTPIDKYFPILEDFVGESGSLQRPDALYDSECRNYEVGTHTDGYEVIGGLQFKTVSVKPGTSIEVLFTIAIEDDFEALQEMATSYLNTSYFNHQLQLTKDQWRTIVSAVEFHFEDEDFNNWLQWVTIQPILRRLFGNSFLPHHDYGKGGRGWRDLWQDGLALLLLNPSDVRRMLVQNFAGVRIDGSNATIIGQQDGQFLSDRNHIVRVWMDHGVWPWITVKTYIDRTGDIDVLFEKQTYFHDQHTHYSRRVNPKSQQVQTLLTTEDNQYYGTLLEHILIENLVPFYNVGSHNIMRLENADWNDGLDMAKERGESVPFTALYASNLQQISNLLVDLHKQGVTTISLLEELSYLLDTLHSPLDFNNIQSKNDRLTEYFDAVSVHVSGQKTEYSCLDIATDLQKKSQYITALIRSQEWLEDTQAGFYNGYYDNDSNRLESIGKNIHMTLTAQVFPIMANVATDDQIEKIIQASDRYLFDEHVGGYRLNTNFNEVKNNMGRMFGFAYGHKENGAVFSHMAVMYANALYQRNFAKAGRKALLQLYKQAKNTPQSKMYPGLPEYFDNRGRGMYSYLTGSASWYLLTLVEEVYGIKGRYGDLYLTPRLFLDDFKNGETSIKTIFLGTRKEFVFKNLDNKEYGDYVISAIEIDGKNVPITTDKPFLIVPKKLVQKAQTIHILLKSA